MRSAINHNKVPVFFLIIIIYCKYQYSADSHPIAPSHDNTKYSLLNPYWPSVGWSLLRMKFGTWKHLRGQRTSYCLKNSFSDPILPLMSTQHKRFENPLFRNGSCTTWHIWKIHNGWNFISTYLGIPRPSALLLQFKWASLGKNSGGNGKISVSREFDVFGFFGKVIWGSSQEKFMSL